MTALPKSKMTVDEFLAWAGTQEGRWELFDGVPVAMSPERAIHGRVKLQVANALERAIEAAGLPCQALLDSVAVRIERHRSYQPDALVSCGDAVPDDATEATNPIVVVDRLVIHHARSNDAITTRIVSAGSLTLDPPGIEMTVADLFPSAQLGDSR